jgi:soluble lytic murein transglycosylase
VSRRWHERLSHAGVVVTMLAVVAACGRQDSLPHATTAGPDASASVDAASEAGGASSPKEARSPLAWPDAIRAGRYAEAAEGISPDRLPAGEQAKPEVRLAKARVSIALGKHADAVAALDKLDDELPLLRELIAKTRAQAMFEVGPFDKAAEWFGTRRDVGSLVLSAEAWEKADAAAKAKIAWDRVVATDKHSRAQEEKARHRRMTITRLKEGEPAAAADARWLAINTLDDKIFSEAAEVLEKLSPPKLLTADELMARSRVLADAARSDDALRMVERATTRGNISAIDLCRARAEIYWKARSRYPEAALAYRSCAAMGSAHAEEDAFLSARSFTRAERDGDAIPAYEAVIQKHPRSTYAEQATFQIARAHALAGRWKDAAIEFDDYFKRFPNGKEKREAERYRALAHLIARNDKKARKLLEDLSGSAEDPITAARWTNLAALAALRDGDKLHALARWADVARTRPLTYPALVARAQLKQHGGTIPPALEPTESGTLDPIKVELPPPADMLQRIGFDAEAEEALREREPAVVAKMPTRGTEALCAAYGLLDRGKRLYQISLQIPQQQLMTAPGGRNRQAWECMFPRPYDRSVRAAAEGSRVPADLVWSVMRQESAFDPEVVSPARAVGLMQLLPETAKTTAASARDRKSVV